MNRASANPHSPNAAPNDVKPTPKNEPSITPRKNRRPSVSSPFFAAGGRAAGGLVGIGGATRGAFSAGFGAGGAVGFDLAAASDLEMGPAFPCARAAARMLDVSRTPRAAGAFSAAGAAAGFSAAGFAAAAFAAAGLVAGF